MYHASSLTSRRSARASRVTSRCKVGTIRPSAGTSRTRRPNDATAAAANRTLIEMIGKRNVAIVIAGWTTLALAAGVQGGLDAVLLGRAATWPASFRESFLDWYSCALFIPILFVLVARWPLGRASGPAAWAAYAAVVAFPLLKFVVWVPLLHVLQPDSKLSLLQYILGDFVFQFFAFSAVVGLLLSLVYYRSFRDREMRAAHLEATLASRSSTHCASSCDRTSSSTRSTASPR